jgi:MYXO-CTERM domain-containing protein
MTTGTSIVDDNGVIGTEIVGQIAAGHLPAPTYDAQGYPNTLYVAFFPQNYNISLTGLQSCQDFGGYHNSIAYTAPTSCKGQYLPYAVIVDCGEEGDQLADIVSHELAEAVTDTDVGTYTGDAGDGAWYLGPTNPCILGPALACPMNCGEVADVCEAQGNDGVVPGSAVTSQDIWSQAQNNCALSNPGTPQQSGPTQTSMTCTTEGSSSSSGGGTTDAGVSSSGSSGGSSSGSGSSSGGRGSGGLAPGDSGSVLPEGGSGADPDAGDGASSSGSSGCGCSVPEDGASRDAGWIAGLLVLAWLCRGRRSKRV